MTQQNKKVVPKIMETNVDIQPVGVIYNVASEDIEAFATKYLSEVCGIDGVLLTRTDVVRNGNYKPEIKTYVFLRQNSRDVVSGLGKIDNRLAGMIEQGGYRATDKFNNALKAISVNRKIMDDRKNRVVFVELDIFRILALMLDVDRNRHLLNIAEVSKVNKNGGWVGTVYKYAKFVNNTADTNGDKYTDIIKRINRNR